MIREVIVIGAGASGMAAAISASGRGLSVTLLEKKEQSGKKLLLTGNGRCNFTNQKMSPAYYHSTDDEFLTELLKQYPTERILEFMSSLGIFYTEKNGYYYPYTNQAQTVLAALNQRMKALGVRVLTNVNVTDVKKGDDGTFQVFTQGAGTFISDSVILAAGSQAGVKDSRMFTGYRILESFGHTVHKAAPVLTRLHGQSGYEAFWDGVRANGRISVMSEDGGIADSAEGEIQFTGKGLSGIPVFQVSHTVSVLLEQADSVWVYLDLLPEVPAPETEMRLRASRLDPLYDGISISDFLQLWLPKKLVPTVLKCAGVSKNALFSALSTEALSEISLAIKAFPYQVRGTGDFLSAQASRGGADPSEFSVTCESRLVPGLFATGELLDVDGLCGGYNLHFAWATGLSAGRNV